MENRIFPSKPSFIKPCSIAMFEYIDYRRHLGGTGCQPILPSGRQGQIPNSLAKGTTRTACDGCSCTKVESHGMSWVRNGKDVGEIRSLVTSADGLTYLSLAPSLDAKMRAETTRWFKPSPSYKLVPLTPLELNIVRAPVNPKGPHLAHAEKRGL